MSPTCFHFSYYCSFKFFVSCEGLWRHQFFRVGSNRFGMHLEILAQHMIGGKVTVHAVRRVLLPQLSLEDKPIKTAQHAKDDTGELL